MLGLFDFKLGSRDQRIGAALLRASEESSLAAFVVVSTVWPTCRSPDSWALPTASLAALALLPIPLPHSVQTLTVDSSTPRGLN